MKKTLIPSILFILSTISLSANEKYLESITSLVKPQEPVQKETIIVQAKKYKGFYVAFATGFSYANIQESGSASLLFKPENSGFNISPEVGYYFNNNFFVSLNYQMSDLKDTTLNSVFTTLNYKFDKFYSSYPFLGVVAGYTQQTWEKSPISSNTGVSKASSLMGGLQAGCDIPIDNGLSLYLYYRYLIMDASTNVYDTSGNSEIVYKGEHNFNLGIKYNF